ncbi:hypothetical protein J1N09_00510 [Aureitalea sp. L0-47]|uniref:hypothetical protein n=1 Tax=Aureitalea sp. L0-47 TaxID=2816962 RepID=UPI0022381615|nr:hypothetical protein [Aureitalea sp. L0-47]MCW5518298.1 hypothetical protein [Aureitalea sp. L0-47]
MDKETIEKRQERYLQVEKLIDEVVEMYYKDGCACQHPRFIQIAGIDCVDYNTAFVSWETELMIGRVGNQFSVKKLEPTESEYLEEWCCDHCGSVFQLSWSEFSPIVDRRVLKPIKMNIEPIGKEAQLPIPLHAGLYGHGYPSRSEISGVDLDSLSKYLLEND